MSSATGLSWFARHELRLAWREWLAMMTGGRRRRTRAAIIGLIVFAAVMHLPAWAVVGRFAALQAPLDKSSLIVLSATIFLAWALMLSQAIESVTRVFYARADLDLIMSSPATLPNIFSIRIVSIAISVTGMALLLSTPFVDVLAFNGGPRWFAAFGVVAAIGLSAAAFAIAITIILFRLIGPARTRLIAQILAAVIGAGFVIALQIAAILSYGTLSRFAVLTSDAASGIAPDADSIAWWPARAVLGDGEALMLLLASSLVILCRIQPASPGRARLSWWLAAGRAAAQGVPAAAARSLADVADPDAAALSRAARHLSLAQLFRQLYRHRADHARDRDGRGPARGWPRLAHDFGRGRRRPGRDRTIAALARDPRQDRGGADRDQRGVRATRRSPRFRRAAPSCGHRGGHSPRRGVVDRDPALVPRAGETQPVSPPPDLLAACDVCGSLLLDRMGRDSGTDAGRSGGCNRQRCDDGGHCLRHLEARAEAGLIPHPLIVR
jgi:hypothetical protein